MSLETIIIAIVNIVLLVSLISFWTAPEGYEDEARYHEGKPDLEIMDKEDN